MSDREYHAFKCLVTFVNRSLLFNNFGDVNYVHCTACIQWTKLLENPHHIFSILDDAATMTLEECQERCVNTVECTGVDFEVEGCYLGVPWSHDTSSIRGLTNYYRLDRECNAPTPHPGKLLYDINVKKLNSLKQRLTATRPTSHN